MCAHRSDTYLLDRGGQILAGRYRVTELLGVGAMGSVWIAEQMALHHEVVVKFHEEGFIGQDPNVALQRFLREARTLASVRHRNVIELFEVGRTEHSEPYLIMERLHGRTLGARLRDDGVLSPADMLRVGMEVASGLEAVHAAGVLHRDVKPENIFLHQDELGVVPKLLDFGLARGGRMQGRITGSGRAVGTPGYMAPEQARGLEQVDHRVDIYALGVVLFELLTQRLPAEGETMMDLMVWTVSEPPVELSSLRPELPRPLTDVVMKALERRPEDRYPDARSMRNALHDVLERLDELLGDPPAAPPAPAEPAAAPAPAAKTAGDPSARAPWRPGSDDNRFDDLDLPPGRTPPSQPG